jgi:diguanylate cyclase (GGDEF)-like protein
LARLTFYLSCALTLAYTVWILVFPFEPETESVVSSILIVLFLLLTTILGGGILRLPGFPAVLRRTWILIILAAFSQMVAEILWFYYQTILGVDPFPSSADFFYILYYIFLFVAVLSLPFSSPRRQERTLMAMDIFIVILVGILFLYYFILAPLYPDPNSAWTLDLVVVSIYPYTDLLILVALFSFLQRDVERVSREVILLLCASMLFTLLADVGWLVFGSYQYLYPDALMDWLWTIAALSLMIAAYWQSSHPIPQTTGKPIHFRPLLRDLVLYFFTGAAFLLMLASAIDVKVSDMRYYAVILASMVLGVSVMLRQYIILVENRRLYHEMEHLATIDTLTGLNNRRSFDRAIEIESRRAERFEHPYAVLMMDVDNFKLYNDRFGHLGGDVVLKRMAELLLMNLRMTDFLARFGGDEFVAILPETGLANAKKVASKIMDEAKDLFIRESIGLSVGVAVWEPGLSYFEVIDAADRELYKSKQLLRR